MNDDALGPARRSGRIAVMLARWSISGVPLAQHRLARALAERGHRVDLVVGWRPPDLAIPEVEGVTVVALGRPKVRGMLPAVVGYLRRARPDIVFAAEDHLVALTLLAAVIARSPAKISGSSRVTPFDTFSDRPLTKRWWLKQLIRPLWRRADALTCVSADMVEQYRAVFGDAPHRCVYNVVRDPDAADRLRGRTVDGWRGDGAHPVVVGAGSLVRWKGFDDLIRAAALLRDRGRSVRLVLLGEGPERGRLEALASELGVAEQVALIGRVADPLPYFAQADAFALSSHVEGLPNVLVEAMMAGCTPVAADCPTGPREVLGDGRYGYLVRPRDPADLAAGIERALTTPIPPERLAEGVAPFDRHRVLRRHFEMLGVADWA